MQERRAEKTWFNKMKMLAFFAVFILVASPAFAANCCCASMMEAGHSHGATFLQDSSTPLDDHSHHNHNAHDAEHREQKVDANNSTSSIQAYVADFCEHTQCEVAPVIVSEQGDKNSLFSPLFALIVRPYSLQAPDVLAASAYASRDIRPRAPDRFSSSGLSPPTLLQS